MTTMNRKIGSSVRVKVIGVGGGGCNAVIRMIRERPSSTVFHCLNTDGQALASVPQQMKIVLGQQLLHGLGAGGDPQQGRLAAEESSETIMSLVKDCDMIFITAGMGGGTGTGAAPVIARLARKCGVLTVGIVTRPFFFEGGAKHRLADDGIKALEAEVDSLIIVPNDRLLNMNSQNLVMTRAFKLADNALRQGVFAIADVLECKGEVNVDFADVRSVLKGGGRCLFAMGQASRNSAVQASYEALESRLLETNLKEVKKALLVVSGGRGLKLADVQAASVAIQKALHPDAHIIFGITTDQTLKDQIKVTLIASAQPREPEVTVCSQDISIPDSVRGLEMTMPLWSANQQDVHKIAGVIRYLDSDFREITVIGDDGDEVTLALTEATQLIKDSCEASFERLRIGDLVESASRYDPSTGTVEKLVVKQRRIL